MRCRKVFVTPNLRCTCAQSHCLRPLSRNLSTAAKSQEQRNHDRTEKEPDRSKDASSSDEKDGAMSRRLNEMAEEAVEEGGKSARKNIQEAGFSEELKAKLEDRIAAASFKSDHAAAFSIADMPASAGKGTQDIASSQPWTGTESTYDASLRMLDDASKPMRVPFRPPSPGPVNLKPKPKSKLSSGQRLASARDRTSDYALTQDGGLSEKERESIRNGLREGLVPGARTFPGTLRGLNALANERIEDAIARGQFQELPRGKGKNVERDHVADTPHLDTTEYLMNRILQKQQVTPEWIQKQQELNLELERFRQRLRADWRRHATRLIARQGGSLQAQIRRAQAYAEAEARRANPVHNKFAEKNNDDESSESRTQIDHEGKITRPSSTTSPSPPQNDPVTSQDPSSAPAEPLPALSPLRDPQYLSIDKEYHTLSIKKLNDQIRSYNLQAPQVSQRSYLTLARELDRCYAEVAPSLPEEVSRRATEKAHDSTEGHEKREDVGLQQKLGVGQKAAVYDEDSSKGYGFKQFWRDLWSKEYRQF